MMKPSVSKRTWSPALLPSLSVPFNTMILGSSKIFEPSSVEAALALSTRLSPATISFSNTI